jgi:hypothetical protein
MAAQCPLCGSRALGRDSGSARAWALLALGAGLLVFSRMVFPATLPLLLQAAHGETRLESPEALKEELDRARSDQKHVQQMEGWVFFVGVACVLLGAFDVALDKSRYCAKCGFRGRFASGGKTAAVVQENFGPSRQRRESHPDPAHDPIAADQPVTPLLRMLRFRDEEKRKDAAETLKRLTGEDFGTDAEAWEAWWEENKDAFKASRQRDR